MRLLLIGNRGGTNVAESLGRAAEAQGIEVEQCNSAHGFSGARLLAKAAWRLARRPLRLTRFSADVVERARNFRPDLILATGHAPLTASALRALSGLGFPTANYLTDDPWNDSFRSEWLLHAIREYAYVFSPRTANLDDLRRLGCRNVEWLPFGYDADLFFPQPAEAVRYDVAFAGGADPDRVPLIAALIGAGLRVGLFGAYWGRYRATREQAGGWLALEQLRAVTTASLVNLCLVRRANRDGHVMRSFELPALGACMLAERTAEHESILGDSVAYFDTIDSLVLQTRALVRDPVRRQQLAEAARRRITVEHGNTYGDRLRFILNHVPCS